VILVATAGKFGGTLAAARLTGLGWRESAALGTLMNTRGLMELIVLNIGLDLGFILTTLFATMIPMALATTMAITPALELLGPMLWRSPAPAQRETLTLGATGKAGRYEPPAKRPAARPQPSVA
jgi:Kef-type K+ transport system membrane component KefB